MAILARHRALVRLALPALALVGVFGGFVAAQDRTPVERAGARSAPADDCCWPSKRAIELFANRIADELAAQYDMDDDQFEQTRDILQARFPAWFEQNRGEISSLTNEYLEAIWGDEPPTPEQVSRWSGRTLRLVSEFGKLAEQTTDEMHAFMTDAQASQLDSHVAILQFGMQFVQGKLGIWQDGGYNPDIDWPRGERHVEYARSEEQFVAEKIAALKGQATAAAQRNENAAEPAPSNGGRPAPARPAAPKDEWVTYTEEFIRKYDLSRDQRERAYAILRGEMDQRDRYLQRKLKDIERVEQQVLAAKTDDDKGKAGAAYQRLIAPLDRGFERLRERLDTLPTRSQRAAAAEAEKRDAEARKAKTESSRAPADKVSPLASDKP